MQPSTPLKSGNSTDAGIVISSIYQKKSKAMGIRFEWVKDWVSQKYFLVYWEPGTTNGWDYFTKKLPPIISYTGLTPVRPIYDTFFTTVVVIPPLPP